MRRAFALAERGQGFVEPNPMVGCIAVRGGEVVGEGWHRRFGGPHAEIEALQAASKRAEGSTLIVTLEPCCHHGKTPPCTDAIIAAGVREVILAQRDPFPQVNGGGVRRLEEAGIEVRAGLLEDEARRLNAPYLKLIGKGRPWIIAKWAMTLDGKIATRAGHSRWISGEASRAVVHQLRGRVDAIMVGAATARLDDPLLTARPPGPRIATRIVLDSAASLSLESQLVRTARETPLVVIAGPAAMAARIDSLRDAGCEVLQLSGATHAERLQECLNALGERRMTNVLVEGGAQVLGALRDAGEIDEVHVFLAPKLIGGVDAPSPLAGLGCELMTSATTIDDLVVARCDDDIHLRGRIRR
ncbi:MAG: bifunctional diaminohydroxyphosphoribosylaminopyrimidine deaminase/5-amino-6-(5-phosphoribosylamino)uracil reductase RibD [Planctomycetes bacterium]|nr:bifunctional diaminohydroxyphosphoribosylaminopyrimidine deaminase/5-amino-6-(5-phosphoribosylamino)uracil reductase RibD [Planctomycetota bacterium]